MFLVIRIGISVFVLSLAILSSGCARLVTPKTLQGNTISIFFACSAPPNFSQYNYYIVFSKTTSLQTPNRLQYLFTPGKPFQTEFLIQSGQTVSDYYQNYFSTWSDYLAMTQSTDLSSTANNLPTTEIFNGPFDPNTTEATNLNYQPNTYIAEYTPRPDQTIWGYTIPAYYLSVGQAFHFTIISTSKSGTIADVMDSGVSIPLDAGTSISGDGLYSGQNVGWDLVEWGVRIY